MNEKGINSFITFDVTKEDGLLILSIFLGWLSVVWVVKTVGRNRKWLSDQWKEIMESDEAKQAREEKEQRAREKEREIQWQNLITETGYHYGLSLDRCQGDYCWSEEDYEKNRQLIITGLRGFDFSMPDEADMLEDDFDEKWLKFLEESRSNRSTLAIR